MSNPYSKGMEIKKEKEQSDYMKEIKEKTLYKKYDNIFETIQQIKKEKKKINEKEYQQFIKFREKCIEIEWFPISVKCIKELFNSLPWSEPITWEIHQSHNNKNETLDFLQEVIEGFIHDHLKDLNK